MGDPQTYSCQVKGVRGHDGVPRRGAAWALSRRGFLRFFGDRVVLGDWVIPFSEIVEATVHEYKTLWVFTAGVLELKTADGATYHFGYNPWASPGAHLPTSPGRATLQLTSSPLSVAVRLFALGYLAMRLYELLQG